MGATSDTDRTNFSHPVGVKRLKPAIEELVFAPALVARPYGADIVGKRDDPTIQPWGLWGAVSAAVVAFSTLIFEGWRGFHNWSTVTLAVLLMAVALIAARFGPRSSLVPVTLAKIDLTQRHVRVGDGPPLPFSEVQEVVYAMVKYPVEPGNTAVKVDAFTVLLRNEDGDLLPLLEASPDKNEVFHLAKACSRWTGLEITHVGLGVKS
ncbi:MAG: hypothetical protein R3E66_24655 [bacterium]